MTRAAYPLPFGATVLDERRTRFRIWAPDEAQLQLEIEGQPPQPMTRSDDGWFEAYGSCGAGACYHYRLDNGVAVPDPASRAQADDVHGDSVVIDPRDYDWQHPQWQGRPWHETVLYELHPGACGGFRGIIERLPALAALGITAIELMPVNDFPGARNWGYDGVLPYAPDAVYGAPHDFKQLIDTAHGLGLSVFLDVVYNHFGPDGAYLHAYAPRFFREDRHTPWGAAIDFRRPQVRDYFIYNALYWLHEYRLDGLRFDAVHAIEDDGFLAEMVQRIRATIAPHRHVHLVLENEDNRAELLGGDRYDAQWNDDAHNALHVLLTGEHEGYYLSYAERPADQLARVLAEGFCYQGEPMPSLDGKPRGSPSGRLPPTSFVFFLQNHDQIGNRAFGQRLIELADPQALRAATLLQLLCPQIPLLFMGEEWGTRTPFLFFTDHNAELAPKVTAGRRREFARFSAFSDPAQRERIPDPNDPLSFHHSVPDARESAHGDHADWLAWYRQLLQLRHAQLIPRLVGARARRADALGSHAVAAQWTLGDGALLTIVANIGADAAPVAWPVEGHPLIETRDGVASAVVNTGSMPGLSACACLLLPDSRGDSE
ncbi:malto-oligosyltrehalose trehalohydrolase [Solimonas marina]|uniref:Malto-oligosyltrehalose trehalohydrolase n=1 Tax=Solimonas marina TaxID=2714601 RepID=A0A970B9A0_9GAMM|nr:malto-oligosyltrehalose trehalohydrolase [Solimonas marina]NKF23109.1 malto-oligosyltrehalose trehalohydrolase [Solimonas marina]